MYKSKLQELCHQRAWNLPAYVTSREGPDHNPRFQATVSVNSLSFQSQNICRSSKEAQNDAAHIAFLQLSAPPGSSTASTNLSSNIATGGAFQLESKEANQTPQLNGAYPIVKDDMQFKEMHNLYKNQLQSFAQKRSLGLPMYSCEREGPPHASRFRCKVLIGTQTFESLDFFPTIREAEHAAAKAALVSLSEDGVQEDSSFYKNLLQELAQKEGYPLPVYATVRSGEAHTPTFVSTLEVEGEVFKGEEARTKKQAEISAAKVAYTTLKERKSSQNPTFLSPACQGQEALENSSSVLSNVNDNQKLNFEPKDSMIFNSSLNSKQQAVEGGEHFPKTEVSSHHLPKPEDGVSSSYLPSSCSSNLVTNSGVQLPVGTSTISCNQLPVETSTLSGNKVVVRPRVANMTFPSGYTVLPMSDDDWVALKLNSQPNQ